MGQDVGKSKTQSTTDIFESILGAGRIIDALRTTARKLIKDPENTGIEDSQALDKFLSKAGFGISPQDEIIEALKHLNTETGCPKKVLQEFAQEIFDTVPEIGYKKLRNAAQEIVNPQPHLHSVSNEKPDSRPG